MIFSMVVKHALEYGFQARLWAWFLGMLSSMVLRHAFADLGCRHVSADPPPIEANNPPT